MTALPAVTLQTVGLGGLGAIGMDIARRLDAGAVPGLRLTLAAARDPDRARAKLASLRHPPALTSLRGLADADIVIEALPAAVFDAIAEPAVAAGRVFMPLSAGALLTRPSLVATARGTGARIIVPTGALLGFDAVRAAAEGRIDTVRIETRKPPAGLAGAPYLLANGPDMATVTEAVCVFRGNAFEAAQGFPANVNVVAALALAGIGAERTQSEIWADPGVVRNVHIVTVEAEAARFTMRIEGVPSAENPRTGRLTPLSVIACLRGLAGTLRVGS